MNKDKKVYIAAGAGLGMIFGSVLWSAGIGLVLGAAIGLGMYTSKQEKG